MKEITITLSSGEKLIVKQLPLRRYDELLRALENVPKLLGNVDTTNNEEFFNKLPLLLASSFPDLLKILTVATDLTKEQISSDDFGLQDGVKVAVAIMQVNDYKAVFEEIKKATAQLKPSVSKPAN
jgi:hypothetical protein